MPLRDVRRDHDPRPASRPVVRAVRALLVLPVPCDARLFGRIISAVARQWEREHPGRTLTVAHWETRRTEFGDAVVVWDEPVVGLEDGVRAG